MYNSNVSTFTAPYAGAIYTGKLGKDIKKLLAPQSQASSFSSKSSTAFTVSGDTVRLVMK